MAGSVLTAAQLNTYLSSAMSFFIGGMPLCIVRQTVAQSIPNTGGTAITFDTEDIDRDGMHSTVTNTSRLTAQTAGYYSAYGLAAYASNATGSRAAILSINGTGVAARAAFTAAITGVAIGNGVGISTMVYLNVGDYLELLARQDSGGALNTGVVSPQSALSVRWVSTA